MLNEKAGIVSFVAAASNSGKTTLIEKIIPLLKARGLLVAVVKHAHGGGDADRPGKDTWRFREAGADDVVLIGPDRQAHAGPSDAGSLHTQLEILARRADLVILEGFKKIAQNKVEVFREGISGAQPLCLTDPSILALVSDTPLATAIPRFDSNDIAGITEYLVANFVREEKC